MGTNGDKRWGHATSKAEFRLSLFVSIYVKQGYKWVQMGTNDGDTLQTGQNPGFIHFKSV